MILYEPTPTPRWYKPKLTEKECKELYNKLLEYGFEPYESTLWEDLKALEDENYGKHKKPKDHRYWFVKLLDSIFDLLSTDVMNLFRRDND